MKITVLVTPNASVDKIGDRFIDERGREILRVKTKQVAEDGKANKAVLELLFKYLKVSKKDIVQVSGFSFRLKIFEIMK